MTSLIAAAVEPATPSLGATPATRHLVLAPVPEVGRPNPAPQAQPQPALTALSRVRGGMYSSTVDLIRFADEAMYRAKRGIRRAAATSAR